MVGYRFSSSYPLVMAAIVVQHGQHDRPSGHVTGQQGDLTGSCSSLSYREREL